MLVGALAMVLLLGPAGAQPRCTPTKPDMLGPFYTPNAPERSRTGQGLVVSGTVRRADCRPLPGAVIEWWSANRQGTYDDEHRATQRADGEGRYRYETDVPGRYPGRPPHLHLKVTAVGHRPFVTQIYPTPGQTAIAADLVLPPP
jgi:protocatechuate 3,4-dioxygenase beta subunit